MYLCYVCSILGIYRFSRLVFKTLKYSMTISLVILANHNSVLEREDKKVLNVIFFCLTSIFESGSSYTYTLTERKFCNGEKVELLKQLPRREYDVRELNDSD